jgi:hypothetical protein
MPVGSTEIVYNGGVGVRHTLPSDMVEPARTLGNSYRNYGNYIPMTSETVFASLPLGKCSY